MVTVPARADAAAASQRIAREVIRNRLEAINDEQAVMAARLAGSPVVYEAFDFNASILSASGESLFVGNYVVFHAASLDSVVKAVIERFGADDRIHPGDTFITNDPWLGALHQSDYVTATPIFYGEDLVAWSAFVMHEMDSGGPVPGSFVVDAQDAYGEPPIIPPVKLIERGVWRPEIQNLLLRNVRTPDLNRLGLHARSAAAEIATARIRSLIDKYGIDSYRDAVEQYVDEAENLLRARLSDIPDGTWFDRCFIDHDPARGQIFEIRAYLRKEGQAFVFDFSETCDQAPVSVNCTRYGLESAVYSMVLETLCYGMPWSTAAARRVIRVESRPGSLVDALHPAGVNLATSYGIWMSGNVAQGLLSKMLRTSQQQSRHVTAGWYPTYNGVLFNRADDPVFVALPMDVDSGGGGALTYRDGTDAAGPFHNVGVNIPNVETSESLYPFLHLYRRLLPDSAGHGAFRGGLGLENAWILHGCDQANLVTFSAGNAQPESKGLGGGYPGSIQGNVVLRDSRVRRLLGDGQVPVGIEGFEGAVVQVLAGKTNDRMGSDDVHVNFCAGGGGFGDPLLRDPTAVLRDVTDGHISSSSALEVYGVSLGDAGVDEEQTRQSRDGIRRSRLARVTRPLSYRPLEGALLRSLGGSLEVVADRDGGQHVRCVECRHSYGSVTSDPKCGAAHFDEGLELAHRPNLYRVPSAAFLRSYCCPHCASLIAVDVVFDKSEAMLPEMSLASIIPWVETA